METRDPANERWRTGRKLGRTIYAVPRGSTADEDDYLIGIMDDATIAGHIVAAHNFWIDNR